MLGALLILSAANAQQSRPAGDQSEYAAILLNGKKVGWSMSLRTEEGGKVTTVSEMSLSVSRAGVAFTASAKSTTLEAADGQPLSFTSSLGISGMEQKLEGKIEQGKLKLTASSGGVPQQEVKPWPEGAVMSEGLLLAQRKAGLEKGTQYKVRVFEPATAQAMEVQYAVGEKKEIDLLGRVVQATEMTMAIAGLGGEKGDISYVDDDFRTLKGGYTMAGLKMEMLAMPKAMAQSKPEVFDAFDAMLVSSPTALADVKTASTATYELQPKGTAKLSLLEGDYQKVQTGSGGAVTLSVSKIKPAGDYDLPYKGDNKTALDAMKQGRYVQSDDKRVAELARGAVGDEKSAATAAGKLESFVASYIKKKNLSIGYASAAEVAKSRQGDCTEHAVLLAAMCRAAGLPAQVVCGIVYVPELGEKKDVFGGHAWVQAYVGKQWVPLDAALKGFDVGHIAFCAGDGNPEDFLGIVNTFGNFTITKAQLGR
jgi:hypothetical protein